MRHLWIGLSLILCLGGCAWKGLDDLTEKTPVRVYQKTKKFNSPTFGVELLVLNRPDDSRLPTIVVGGRVMGAGPESERSGARLGSGSFLVAETHSDLPPVVAPSAEAAVSDARRPKRRVTGPAMGPGLFEEEFDTVVANPSDEPPQYDEPRLRSALSQLVMASSKRRVIT